MKKIVLLIYCLVFAGQHVSFIYNTQQGFWFFQSKMNSEYLYDGRVIRWNEPVTNWAWKRTIFHRTDSAMKWTEFTELQWDSTSVKINDWWIGNPEILVVLIR